MDVDAKFIRNIFEQDVASNLNTDKLIRKICVISNVLYFVFHMAYLIYFIILRLGFLYDTRPMIYVSIFSASYYLILFVVLKFKKYNIFVMACGLEIAAFMTYSTIVCGFDSGFHLCLIGLLVLAYFSGYYSQKKTQNLWIFLILCYNI